MISADIHAAVVAERDALAAKLAEARAETAEKITKALRDYDSNAWMMGWEAGIREAAEVARTEGVYDAILALIERRWP